MQGSWSCGSSCGAVIELFKEKKKKGMFLTKNSTTLRIHLPHPTSKKEERKKGKSFERSHLPSASKKLIPC